jgi:purine-binding chemotaxis protein CheW
MRTATSTATSSAPGPTTTASVTTMVCFRAGDSAYAIPVEHVREVRSGADLEPLPGARPDVVGLMADRGVAVTVVAPLGRGNGNGHVLVVEHGGRTFGLAVGAVTAVVAPNGRAGPPPAGQIGHLISGVITTPDGLLLVVDVGALDESFHS